ncbi:aminotransferase class V-fold PLP-dependent enzyme [Aquimarina intermedia]|uniref:Selenocysteine lyase/cysteine desulfurase n=1 Tax=Aquimarina intermedia TaxID=350814 RepID=A0A5S5CC53_9FLAO|nr:aminotransferase class V-fold PLP-dependent enzyme [Aquimarina intermedia]TYP75930.1 selenocysteine lyase/cysteine desulfurase [Aquimarina intermedia]
MKNLRKEFPVVNQYTYLNTAYSGPLSTQLINHRRTQDQLQLERASLYRIENDSIFSTVKRTIGSCFGAQNSTIVLTQNFSVGINTIFNGLSTKSKVLLLENDYPAMQTAVASKGFDTKYVRWDKNIRENIKSVIDSYTPDIFAFSIVHYISGAKMDLAFIKDLKETYPNILFIADATQFCGTSAFDFENSGIDILGSSGYKWLLGGYGNAFFAFQKDTLEAVTPTPYKKNISISSAPDDYKSLEARFQPGHLDTFNFSSLNYSLKFLQGIGFDRIEKELEKLKRKLWFELADLNLIDTTNFCVQEHSSILNISGDKKLFQSLNKERIVCSQRGTGIRFSLHFFNSEDDIEHVIAVLKKVL